MTRRTLSEAASPSVRQRSPTPAASLSSNSPVSAYVFAVGTVAVVTVIKMVFEPFLGTESPYFIYFGAVMGSAWYGGFRPGLVATVLSAFLAHFYFVQPTYELLKPEWGRNFL